MMPRTGLAISSPAPGARRRLHVIRCPLVYTLLLALILASAGPARAEPPAAPTSSQDAWVRDFERQYPRYKNIGQVSGPREEGQRTGSGIRVPTRAGYLLAPRPFYLRREAAFVAWQGYIHYAELLEVGHDAVALAMHNALGRMPRDNQLDLAAYTGWSQTLAQTRDDVAMTVALGDTAMAMTSTASTLAASRASASAEAASATAVGAGTAAEAAGATSAGAVSAARAGEAAAPLIPARSQLTRRVPAAPLVVRRPSAWPPKPPKGPKPPLDAANAADWRYQRYRYKAYKQGKAEAEVLTKDVWHRKHFEPAQRGGRPGRPGGKDHQADVARNNDPNRIKDGPIGNRWPDSVGEPGQPLTIRGVSIKPAGKGRVIVESDHLIANGTMPDSACRAQMRDIRKAQPDATLVVTDQANPRAAPLIYPPGTQPPPPGRLPRAQKPVVPYP